MICKHLLFLSLSRYGCIHIQNIDDSIFAVKILQNDASCEDNLICENTAQVNIWSCMLRFMGSWSIIIIDKYLLIYLYTFFSFLWGKCTS